MLIVDSFAGGGGASTGIALALGRSPDIAINHNPVALAMHAANHPETLHLAENVWKVNLELHTGGRKVGLLWASPDCRHFSKARGGQPTSKSVRGLAWSIVRFVHDLGRNRPDVICLENVDEFLTWEDFPAWSAALRRLGYKMKHWSLRACDYGAPTIRKRLFIVLRRDGKPIVKPEPTHGDPNSEAVRAGKLKPWRMAAEIIDWQLPCPSIFDSAAEIWRKHHVRAVRPLAENTCRRIAAGVMRYVVEAEEPFFVTHGQQGGRSRSASDPLHTVTASRKDTNAIVVPTLVQAGYGERPGQAPRMPGLDKPLGTVVAGGGKHALVAAFLAQHNSDRNRANPGREARAPLSTITGRGTQQQVVAAHLISLKGSDRRASDLREPARTVCAGGTHAGLVAAFLTKYYGNSGDPRLGDPLHTVTTRDRFGLVTVRVDGADYVIADIGMRMLTPRELFRAQGFDDSYVIDRDGEGRPIGKSDQIHKCGNSVCPPVVQALVAANWPEGRLAATSMGERARAGHG